MTPSWPHPGPAERPRPGWAERANRVVAHAEARRASAEQRDRRGEQAFDRVLRRTTETENRLRDYRDVQQTRQRAAQCQVERLARAAADVGVPAKDTRGLPYFDADFCLTAGRQEMLSALLHAALALGRAELGNVQLLDAAAGGLRIAAQYGFDRDFLRYFAVVASQYSACGVALAQARTVQVSDVVRSRLFGESERGVVLGAGVRAVRSVPLLGTGAALLGVLSVHHRQPYRPDGAEQRLLAILAASAARRILTANTPVGGAEPGSA